MQTIVAKFRRLALFIGLVAALAAPLGVCAQESPQTKEEKQLDQLGESVLDVQEQLYVARQQNDEKEIKRLEKKFKKLQDERIRLLRATWQL